LSAQLTVETSGETVGEAKWLALRELEKLAPGLDKAAVRFEVVSEGERGLLGVGYAPARVVATIDPAAAAAAPERVETDGSELAGRVRELLEEIAAGLGIRCRVDVTEDEETVTASLSASDLGLLIGRHGQTIDAIQYLVNAIVFRGDEHAKTVVVDAAGYRERRQSLLESLAMRTAERVTSGGQPVELEPMSAAERRIVHLRLKEVDGVTTRSEGDEPNRYVVVEPA
jgi:spoIIIJ-associated protein